MLPRPTEHLQLPSVSSFLGALCSGAHSNTSRCPPSAASAQLSSPSSLSCALPHGHPCSRAHTNTSRCPPRAAAAHATYPTGTRAFAPTAATPGARPHRRGYKSTRVRRVVVHPHPLQHPQALLHPLQHPRVTCRNSGVTYPSWFALTRSARPADASSTSQRRSNTYRMPMLNSHRRHPEPPLPSEK